MASHHQIGPKRLVVGAQDVKQTAGRLQALFGFLRTATFRERAAELKGYDVTETGQVRHLN